MAKVEITFENYQSNYVSKVGVAFFLLFCSVLYASKSNAIDFPRVVLSRLKH